MQQDRRDDELEVRAVDAQQERAQRVLDRGPEGDLGGDALELGRDWWRRFRGDRIERAIDRIAGLQGVRQELQHSGELLIEPVATPALEIPHDQRREHEPHRTENDRADRDPESEQTYQRPESGGADAHEEILGWGDVQPGSPQVLGQSRPASSGAPLAEALGRGAEQPLDELSRGGAGLRRSGRGWLPLLADSVQAPEEDRDRQRGGNGDDDGDELA